jgi:23S rRNA (guanosine2251-2'-O)-methyltransferase
MRHEKVSGGPSLIFGYHNLMEALDQGFIRIKEIWLVEGNRSIRTRSVLASAERHNVPVRFRKKGDLARFVPETAHHGMMAVAEPFRYVELADIIQPPSTKHERLILALDHVTDEGNVGAIIRTAAFFGVEGLVLPRERSAGMSPSAMKRSSGGWIHLPVAQVVNLRRALNQLADNGYWIVGTTVDGPDSIYSFDWKRDVVLVMGSEQKGLARLSREGCHAIVRIPGSGRMESLNVSVACGVLLAEIVRQRGPFIDR